MSEKLHVWVVGGSKGLGLSIADACKTQHTVSVSARTQPLTSTSEALSDVGNVLFVPCDVAREQSIVEAYQEVVAKNGAIDVVVYSAGVGVFKDLVDMTLEEFDAQILVNLRGAFLCCKTVVPSMISRGKGMICTLNSVASIKTFPGCTAYGASKMGMLAMTRSLREEVRSHGVKVVDFMIGATATDIWSAEDLEKHHRAMMQSADVASVVLDMINQFHSKRMVVEEVVIRPIGGDL